MALRVFRISICLHPVPAVVETSNLLILFSWYKDGGNMVSAMLLIKKECGEVKADENQTCSTNS